MSQATHDHPACRRCCRATRADGSPCRRKAYIARLLSFPPEPVSPLLPMREEAARQTG